MRLEEIGDYKNGSVAVLGKDGKVRAHAGGMIKFVTVTMRSPLATKNSMPPTAIAWKILILFR